MVGEPVTQMIPDTRSRFRNCHILCHKVGKDEKAFYVDLILTNGAHDIVHQELKVLLYLGTFSSGALEHPVEYTHGCPLLVPHYVFISALSRCRLCFRTRIAP